MIKGLYNSFAERWYRGGSVWFYSDPHFGDEEMKHYEELFEEHKEQLLSYEEFMKETPVKRNVFGHIKEYIMASFKHYAVKMKG